MFLLTISFFYITIFKTNCTLKRVEAGFEQSEVDVLSYVLTDWPGVVHYFEDETFDQHAVDFERCLVVVLEYLAEQLRLADFDVV